MQQSDKHSPVVDDAMQDPRVEAPFGYKRDGRPEEEDVVPAEGGDPRPDLEVPAGHLDPDTVQLRSDLARFLGPSAFPGDRDRLVTVATEHDAPEWVVRSLGDLPDGTFATLEAVWESLGGQPDGPRP